jgi:hypothetical protein
MSLINAETLAKPMNFRKKGTDLFVERLSVEFRLKNKSDPFFRALNSD